MSGLRLARFPSLVDDWPEGLPLLGHRATVEWEPADGHNPEIFYYSCECGIGSRAYDLSEIELVHRSHRQRFDYFTYRVGGVPV